MKKGVAVVVSALAFGVIAGGTMVGVNVLAHQAMPELSASAATESESSAEGQNGAGDAAKKESESVRPALASTTTDLDVSGIVEESMPQVVSITNTMLIKQQGYSSIFDYFYGGGPQQQEYEGQASGSGVILKKTDTELLIVTNNHVVQDSKELSVTFVDGTTVDAAIKGTDSTIDLAIVSVPLADIKKETQDKIKVASLHDKDDLKVGQGVIAIGNALGYGQSVTVGYISALNREIQTEEGTNSDLIQVDAAINPGNSGGALLNMKGELIGINVAKVANSEVEGMGYAIPIYKAMSVIDSLSNAQTKVPVEEANQGRLGIYMNTVTAQQAQALGLPQGVIITGFSDEDMPGYDASEKAPSAAKEAGLQKNDIITKFDGQGVQTAEDLQKLMVYYAAGTKATITYMRLENGEYKEHTADVVLKAKTDSMSGQASGGSGNEQSPNLGLPDNGLGRSDEGGQQGGEQPSENGQEGELYDLFREFMQQNGNGSEGQGQGNGQN